jgi:hypothetical protein
LHFLFIPFGLRIHLDLHLFAVIFLFLLMKHLKVSNSPDTSGTGFWNNHSGTAHTNITPPHTLTKSSSQQVTIAALFGANSSLLLLLQDVEQNPLAKFFGAAVVQQMSMTAPRKYFICSVYCMSGIDGVPVTRTHRCSSQNAVG